MTAQEPPAVPGGANGGGVPAVPPEPVPSHIGNLALQEQAAYASGKLERYKRDETIRKHVHRAGLAAFWMIAVSGGAAWIVWILHLLLPEKYHFLSEAQMRDLQNLIITALGSSIATDYGKRWLSRMDRPTD